MHHPVRTHGQGQPARVRRRVPPRAAPKEPHDTIGAYAMCICHVHVAPPRESLMTPSVHMPCAYAMCT